MSTELMGYIILVLSGIGLLEVVTGLLRISYYLVYRRHTDAWRYNYTALGIVLSLMVVYYILK